MGWKAISTLCTRGLYAPFSTNSGATQFRGAGEDGQLGVGSRHENHLMLPVSDLDGLDVASVVAGSRNSLAICTTGEVSPERSESAQMTL